jgi:hypothetical protein
MVKNSEILPIWNRYSKLTQNREILSKIIPFMLILYINKSEIKFLIKI